jgi:secondary thiamine-phosphate synthase enzyme
MASRLFVSEEEGPGIRVCQDRVELRTRGGVQLVEITALVAERVRRSGIALGLVSVQTLHTTAAVLVNENEPLLLEDLKATLERAAPSEGLYAHDDLDRRKAAAEERRNGHAHCRAALLCPSISLHVAEGRLVLGDWQSVFLVELDGPRERHLSIVVLGIPESA